jgi:simple sugar transport system permease protein
MSVIGIAFVVVLSASLLIELVGASPWGAAVALEQGSVGSIDSIAETLIRFAPLVLIAASLAPSLQAGLFNIGAAGQMGVGALMATIVALELGTTPAWLAIPLTASAGILGGAAWALIPALLRARLQINEILSTFVFNFLAVLLLTYLVAGGPMMPQGATVAESAAWPGSTLLPVLIPDTRAHVGIIVALAGIVCLAIFARTPLGYRVRLFGANNYLGARAGVAETRLVLALLLLGGAVAGLAGWMQVAGVDQRLYPTVAASVGFNGLFVALLGGGRPLGILIASLLFAALLKGGDSLQVASNVSPELINVIVGMIVLGFVARRALAGRVSG